MSQVNLSTDHQKNGERGSVVIMTAISMLLLILMVGLCIDISRVYTVLPRPAEDHGARSAMTQQQDRSIKELVS